MYYGAYLRRGLGIGRREQRDGQRERMTERIDGCMNLGAFAALVRVCPS